MPSALVLDGRAISSLALARELDRAGLTVHSAEAFEPNLTAHSSATADSHTYPPADDRPAAFERSLLALVEREGFDFVLPARDATTRLVADLAESLPPDTHTLLAPADRVERLADKARFADLAVETGVPTPTTYVPSEQGLREIERRADFPVLVKPTNASGARGIRRVERPGALRETYDAVTAAEGEALVQEFVDHAGGHYSVGTVFDRDGAPRAIHVYEELLQYPDSGGPAIRARSVPVEPWVHEMLSLLEAVDWTGPAHMDVLFDPDDGTYKLLEVNPRVWSSIGLAIGSGVGVGKTAYELATGGDPDCVDTYRTDRTYRWTVPNELLWAVDGRNTPRRVRRLLRSDGDRTTRAVLSRADPGATVGALLQSARFLLDAELRAEVLDRGTREDREAPETQALKRRHEN